MNPRVLRILVWILLGIAVRTIALDGNGLWLDEGYTAWTAHLSQEEHETALRNDDAPPLYYAIQRTLLPRLPPNETSVRLVSAAAGIATIAWLAVAPPVPGLIEAPIAFFALGTYGAYYGRQGRSYATLMLWSLILMTATARVLQGKRRWLIGVVLAEAFALWTHNVAISLVVGANLAWLLCGRRLPRGWLLAQGAAIALWVPQLIRLLSAQLAIHQSLNDWIADYWETLPLVLAPLMSLASFTSGAWVTPTPLAYRWSYSGPGFQVLSILALACVVVLLVCAFRGTHRREAFFAASFTLGPLISLVIISSFAVPSYTVARTDAIAYVGFVLWTAIGLRGLPRWGKVPILIVLSVSTLLATVTHFPVAGRHRENDRQLGKILEQEVRPGDWVAFLGASRPSLDYYLSGGRPGSPDTTIHRLHYPASHGRNPAAGYPISGDSLHVWEREAFEIRDRFDAEGGPPDQMFYWVGQIPPGRARENPTAEDIPYPGNILAYVVNGLRPLNPVGRLRGDEVQVDWLIFRVRRDRMIPRDELQPVIRGD